MKEKILAVDDSPTHLKLMTDALEKGGYKVITAKDGIEALELAASEKPAVVVLDVIMPGINGFQVCRKIKTTPELQSIRVLLCTSKTQESDIFWGKKQGADEYLTKPFEAEDLLRAVEGLLSASPAKT